MPRPRYCATEGLRRLRASGLLLYNVPTSGLARSALQDVRPSLLCVQVRLKTGCSDYHLCISVTRPDPGVPSSWIAQSDKAYLHLRAATDALHVRQSELKDLFDAFVGERGVGRNPGPILLMDYTGYVEFRRPKMTVAALPECVKLIEAMPHRELGQNAPIAVPRDRSERWVIICGPAGRSTFTEVLSLEYFQYILDFRTKVFEGVP